MINYLRWDSRVIRRISLFLIIIQSIGIRFFSGLSILLLCLIFLLNKRNLYKVFSLSHSHYLIVLIFCIATICIAKGLAILAVLYILTAIFCSILVLINYNRPNVSFIEDIKPILWFFSIYGAISWLILISVPSIFTTIEFSKMKYEMFGGIFINNSAIYGGPPRLSSLFWEPGCCQFILNFLLLILVTNREKLSKIVFIFMLVLATRSTTGYINIIFIAIIFAYQHKKQIIPIAIGGLLIGSLGIYSMMSSNIVEKFADSSGIIRVRDFTVGYYLASRHPLLGVDTENLSINSEAQILEDEVWGGTQVWTKSQGYFAGGFTNGFMGVFLDYGLIIGTILYLLTLKSPLIWKCQRQINPYCFFAIYFCSLTGEPISRTTLFFLFSLSWLVINDHKNNVNNYSCLAKK